MNGTRKMAGMAVIAAFCTIGNAMIAIAQTPQGQDAGAGKQPYTMAEYNAEQACANDKNPTSQVKCLDDFVSKYPNSALLVYVYPLYVEAYKATKNYQKVMETADKIVSMGDKFDAATRYGALYNRALAYNAIISTDKAAGTNTTLAKGAQDAAATGLKTLDEVKKPENVSDEAFETQKKQVKIFFNGIAAQAAMVQKDYAGAIQSYKAVLALGPEDAVVLNTSYRMGLAYMAMTPPQTMDAFWSFARAATSKGASQAQAKQIKDYLRTLIANYQGNTVCDSLTDSELNELMQLAGSSADRPESYKVPAATDLEATRKDMTIGSVIADLKAGGDKGKTTWLASCGLEFPQVPGKVIDVTPGTDAVDFKIAFVTSDAEFDAATTANMDVKVVGQPEAARVEKNNPIHFTGTLVSFDPDPAFMLHWDKAKVADEDIPKEKETKRPARRPAAKKPSN